MDALSAGNLKTSEIALYEVPASKRVKFESMLLFNTDSSARTFAIYMMISGARIPLGILNTGFGGGYSAELFETPRALNAGDKILGASDVDDKVTFALFGTIEVAR